MLGTVREEVVDEHAANREDKDKETPEHLVRDRTVRFEDLNYRIPVRDSFLEAASASRKGHTPADDI